ARRARCPSVERSGRAGTRPTAHSRDRPRLGTRPASAAARRAGRGPALQGEAGPRRAVARATYGRPRHSAGRARHGLCHEARRPRHRHGVRRKNRRGYAGRSAGGPAGARSLSRRRGMTGDAPLLLSCRNLTVSYGKMAAVRGVDLAIRQGEVVTIVGPNGAGKTSLLSALIGLLPCTGEVSYFGGEAGPPPPVE